MTEKATQSTRVTYFAAAGRDPDNSYVAFGRGDPDDPKSLASGAFASVDTTDATLHEGIVRHLTQASASQEITRANAAQILGRAFELAEAARAPESIFERLGFDPDKFSREDQAEFAAAARQFAKRVNKRLWPVTSEEGQTVGFQRAHGQEIKPEGPNHEDQYVVTHTADLGFERHTGSGGRYAHNSLSDAVAYLGETAESQGFMIVEPQSATEDE